MIRLTLLGLSLLVVGSLPAQQTTRSPHGALTVECRACHRSESWTSIRISRDFDHAKVGFRLAGAHAAAACRSCHQTLDFKGTRKDCTGCHTDVHRGELGADCARCHTPRAFQDREAMVRFHQTTRFSLEGSHLALDCGDCHSAGGQGRLQFVARSTACVSCHAQQYATARDPDHVAGGFPRDCANCHAATVWQRARFNHDATRFPLAGAHRAVACVECHASGRYQGAPTTCIACHQADYDRAASPPHAGSGFSTDCLTCHGFSTWSGAGFDHTARTRFALTGAHRTATCAQCHGDGVFAGKSSACVACHQADYDNTSNPRHTPSAFPVTCSTCHSTARWTGASFSHTWFRTPHHGVSGCAECHIDPNNFQAFECILCHEHNQASMDSKHRNRSGYTFDSNACYRCHRNGD